MAKKPETPSQGKPFEKEQAQLEGKEGGENLAQQQAEQAAAEAPAAEPKPKKPARKKAEGTAAAETGVDKAAAEAVAEGETSTKGAAKDAAATKGKAKASPKKDEEPKTKGKSEAATKAKSETATKAKAKSETATKAKAKAEEKPEDKGDKAATKPAPRKRDQRRPAEAVVVRAHAKYVRSSARKARLVCDQIRGKSVPEARALLAFSPRDVAEAWTKLLDSAVANAEHNHDLVGEDLKVHAVFADEGPTIKRFRPRAMGRATPIHKRTSHLTIQLTPKETR